VAQVRHNIDATPVNFYMEVKATSGQCSTPFFMIPRQHQLMQDKKMLATLSRRSPPKSLFVIVRVLNLFTSSVGIQAYIDPWHLREHTLELTADERKIPPTASASFRVDGL
jgi:hypothetical protein